MLCLLLVAMKVLINTVFGLVLSSAHAASRLSLQHYLLHWQAEGELDLRRGNSQDK